MKLQLEVVKLGPPLEGAFERHAGKDIPHYLFFLLDWRHNRDRTEIWLALRGNEIQGMMLVYDGRIVQLRGSEPAAESLLNKVDLEKAEFNVEPQHRQAILGKFPRAKEYELILMALRRGEEHLYPSEDVVRLTPDDAGRAADLMSSADPEIWGRIITPERIAASMDRTLWFGIFTHGKLVSLGNATMTDIAGNVGAVATYGSYRNRGYATSIVSALLRETLKVSDLALIHVLRDNAPARRIYEKVGFRPYRNYLFGFTEPFVAAPEG